MPYQTITLPPAVRGLNTKDEPHVMDRVYTPSMRNMETDRTVVRKRLGYAPMGTNLPLTGIGMELIEYSDGQGVKHNLAITTRHAYQYNDSTDVWLTVTPQNLLDNMNDATTFTASADVAVADDSTIKIDTTSMKVTLSAQKVDGNLLAYSDDFGATVDISANTQVGFWLYSTASVASGALEIVIAEDSAGAKTNDFIEIRNDAAIVADTWTFFSVAPSTGTIANMAAALSIGIYANATLPDGTVFYIDDLKAYTEFTGGDTDRFSHTVSTNLAQFTSNGGTALVISNGKDGIFSFEGQTGDSFTTLAVSSELSNFAFANEIEDFWNQLFLMNYRAGSPAVDFVRNLAFHDVTDSLNTYENLGITEIILADTRGQLRRAKKLGFDMVLYSDSSISLCRRIGGSLLFDFPTLIYETGLFAEKGIWDFVNEHFFLGTDQKIYSYTGGTRLNQIGHLVETTFFQALDPSKAAQIVTGLDRVRKKVYFFYPKTDDTYSHKYYAINYEDDQRTWEMGELADTVRDFSSFDNQSSWTFDGPQVAGKAFNASEFAATPFSSGSVISGFPQTIFLTHDGYVMRFTSQASKDNATDIECWIDTPDLVPNLGRTDEYARFGNYAFSAKAILPNSTCQVYYTTLGDDANESVANADWTQLADDVGNTDIPLSSVWTQIRIPVDKKTQKIRYRVYQNSDGDLQIRGQSYDLQVNTDR